jgi:hypothetical protein
VRGALAAAHKAAFRVVHFSVQSDHVHLIVEADEPSALVRGVQGLAVRCAKAVNRAVRRRGAVWSSRYHAHALRNPTETRRGLVYVLLNFRKHLRAAPAIDPRSSGPWFDGWQRASPAERSETGWRRASPAERSETGWQRGPAAERSEGGWQRGSPVERPSPVAAPRTWLASIGWRQAGGAIRLDERPAPGARRHLGARARPPAYRNSTSERVATKKTTDT